MAPYRDLPYLGGTTAERIHEQGLSLPSSSGLSDEEARRVADALVDVLSEGRHR
jgi:dTDP-4-amino-4,6-dideoxygalactose transaminase